MESHSNVTYTANGSSRSDGVNLEPESETYHKVHHDLDSAAASRKPIVTESNYKVRVAEPGVEDLHLGHDHHRESENTVSKSKVSKSTHSSSHQKGQFIAKPDVYSDDEAAEDDGEGFPWLAVVGGAAAIAGAIAGLIFLKKRNPDADQRLRRSVEDADHRVKGAFGSGERRVKELIGSGQQKFRQLVGRGGDHSDSDDEGYSHSHGHGRSHNPLNVFDDGDSYKVKQGDNMAKIAKKTGKNSWHDIADKNPSIRNPDLIYPGDHLRV